MATHGSQHNTGSRWFTQSRFGLFIHWGLYSLLERGEWTQFMERIPVREYARLAGDFKPTRFDPDAWAALAKGSGMKYICLTTRHHDGFCLYDSQVSDFTSVKTAARRDFVADYVAAARRAGLRVGLYYSLLDWRFPGYFDRARHPDSFAALVQQAHDQVRELLTQYGKIDFLWFDGQWFPRIGFTDQAKIASSWRAEELLAMIRSLQPDILVNNRTGLPGDYDTPEQHISASAPGRAWETGMTMGDHCGWGCIRHNPNFKTATHLLQCVVQTAAQGGNYILNIGPLADGSVRHEELARLETIGRWMKTYGEAIYGSERVPAGWGGPHTAGGWGGPLGPGMLGANTAKGNRVYVHMFRWPGTSASFCGVKNRILSARLLGTGAPLRVAQASGGYVTLTGLPEFPPDPNISVAALELDGVPEALDYDAVPLPESGD